MDIAKKCREEKKVMAVMVGVYCHGQKHQRKGAKFCPACAALLRYAHNRTDLCPRIREKTFCSKCPSPCYEPRRREEIRAVMRYAAPRVLLRHPLMVIRHMLAPKQKKKKFEGRLGR